MPVFLGGLISAVGGAGLTGLGALGSGLMALGGTLLSGLANAAMQAVVGAVHGVASLGLQAITGAVHLIGNVAVQAVTGVLHLVMSLPSMLMGAVQGLLGILGGVLDGLMKLGTMVGGLVTGALAGFMKALQVSAGAMLDTARSVQELRGGTGLSSGAANSVVRNFGAVGVDAKSVASLFGNQNPTIFGAKAAFWGLPNYTDPHFLSSYASKYQSMMGGNLMDQMMARTMSRSLGLDTPEMRALAMRPAGMIEGNQTYSRGVYASLGLGSAAGMEGYGNTIPSLLDKVNTLLGAIKDKFAVAFLPLLESLLGGITQFGGQQAGGLGALIDNAAQWLFVKAPLIAVQGVEQVLAWVYNFVGQLTDLSGVVAQGITPFLQGASESIGLGLNEFGNFVQTMGVQSVTFFAGLLEQTGDLFAGWFDGIAQFVEDAQSGQNSMIPILKLMAGTIDYTAIGLKGLAELFAFVGAVLKDIGVAIFHLGQALLALPEMVTTVIAKLLSGIPAAWISRVPILGQIQKWAASYQPTVKLSDIDLSLYSNPMDWVKYVQDVPMPDMLGWVENFANDTTLAPSMRKHKKSAHDFFYDLAASSRDRGFGITDAIAGAAWKGSAYFNPQGVGPDGKPLKNPGERLGDFLQPKFQEFSQWMGERQSQIGDALNIVGEYKRSLGTEAQREQRYLLQDISNRMGQLVDIGREQLRRGDAPARGFGGAFNEILREYRMEQVGAIRGNGRR